MSKKLNLQSFTIIELTAKLFVMLRNLPSLADVSRDEYMAAARRLCDQNFIYPDGKQEVVVTHFVLYSLGDEENLFSKTMNEHSSLGA